MEDTREIVILRKILERTKWFVIPAILVLYASTAILMLVGIAKLYYIVSELHEQFNDFYSMDTSLISTHFITIVDIYLLAIVFYIFAIGIYKLFIGEFLSLPWLHIETIDDLKLHISKMTVLFLITLIVQKIAEWGDAKNDLLYSIAIALVSAVLIWYCRILQVKEKNRDLQPKG